MSLRARSGLLFALLASACVEADGASDVDLPEDEPVAQPEVRPDTPGNNLQFNFDRADLVESFASPGGRFRVHFTRAGANAVPDDDDDLSGVPDFVEEVAGVYDEVLDFYTSLGFREPLDDAAVADNGGDDRFDVYLVDFAGVGDGNFQQDGCLASNGDQCRGYMIQENDYAGYGYPSTLVANHILASHEFFHAVQAAYDVGQGSVLAEGTAVWATEQFDPALLDFEYFIDGFLENIDRPLDEPLPGPTDPYSYGAAIFFQFLEEAYGPGTVAALLEATVNGSGGVDDPYWLSALEPVLMTQAGTSFADAIVEFATWNLYTDDFADPEQAYANGSGYSRVRIDPASAPLQDDSLRVYRASSQIYGLGTTGRPEMTAALVAPPDDPEATAGLRLLLATETATAVQVTPIADVSAGAQLIDTSIADRLLVVVVNTALEGESKKPGLCVGTAEEVATCAAAISGQGGEGGGGAGGAAEGGGGEGGGGDGADDASDDGCGCSLPGTGPGHAGGALLALGLLLQGLRRRRSSVSAPPSNT